MSGRRDDVVGDGWPQADPGSSRDRFTPEQEPLVWVIMAPALVPEQWRHRGSEATVIPLLPAEARTLLRGDAAAPTLAPEEERVMSLVARRLRVSSMAEELGISVRGVQHRLARLRRRFHVDTTADLAVLAARWGLGRG